MPELTFQTEQFYELPFVSDENVSPAQMLAPQRRLGLQTAQRPQRAQEQRRESGVASVPFMIGDTGAGSCASFSGFLIDAELSHPTMACGRLNIAENNTPLPTDRVYFSYRHFENATPIRVFQFNKDYNIDRYTMGGELAFADDTWSIEMRLPLENRMSSDFATVDRAWGTGHSTSFGEARRSRTREYLDDHEDAADRTPTVCAVDWLGSNPADVTRFPLFSRDRRLHHLPGFPGITTTRSILVDVVASNETIYLTPFLSWVHQPTSRFFHQGFLQIEVAANPSFFTSR